MGHPTTPIIPVVLAVAENLESSGKDIINAFTPKNQSNKFLPSFSLKGKVEEIL